jgi:hypothetical protein
MKADARLEIFYGKWEIIITLNFVSARLLHAY